MDLGLNGILPQVVKGAAGQEEIRIVAIEERSVASVEQKP